MSKIVTGFEGVITPAILAARRAKNRRALVLQAGELESGLDFGARAVGLAIGGLVRRAFGPDEEKRNTQQAQEIISTARTLAGEQKFEGELAPFDRQIAAVNTAIKGLVDAGLTDRADTLRGNAKTLRAQRFEQRVNLAKLAGTEATTANLIQTNEFNELGDAATVTFSGQPDPITVRQLPDSSIAFIDPQSGVERTLEAGQYTEVRIQGGADEVAPDKVAIRTGIKTMNGMNGLMNIGMQMRRAIVENPLNTTYAAPVLAAINTAAVNARAFLAEEFGKTAVPRLRSRIEKQLGEMGIEQGVMMSRTSQISFAIATKREGGRLTDQDIERAATAAGFGETDPAVRIAVLDSLMLDTQEEFEFMILNPLLSDLPQVEKLNELFVSLENARRDFAVVIPGREGEKDLEDERALNKGEAIVTDPRGSIF